MSHLVALRAAASGLARHPQDHGWRDLYRLFDYALGSTAPQLECLLVESYEARQTSPTHLLTLLGIALKLEAEEHFDYLAGKMELPGRLRVLEQVVSRYASAISAVLLKRQNSFTSARRFLVPQVVLGAYFAEHRDADIRFADFGTGLGILPRQINSATQYAAFCGDLRWPGGIPEFRKMPIGKLFGVDRGPMPDLNWVSACYGRSEYYAQLKAELQFAWTDPEVLGVEVQFTEIDLLDTAMLRAFVRDNQVNAMNLSYVLYELGREDRQEVISALLDHLPSPGVLVVVEPRDELHNRGCVVEVHTAESASPIPVCYVSDGHFKGDVLPLEGYREFFARYPIRYLE